MSEDAITELVNKQLLGELLTIADAVASDKQQRDAIKSLIRRAVSKCADDLRSSLNQRGR
jgi:hypothetical protein